MTEDFYKNTSQNIILELINYKNTFLNKLNNFFQQKNIKIIYPEYNYGLVNFITNKNNITSFNNGTYHINITLPTQLDENGKIKDFDKFIINHKKLIHLIQWMEVQTFILY